MVEERVMLTPTTIPVKPVGGYRKNINYIRMDEEIVPWAMDTLSKNAWLLHRVHHKAGIQLQVSKEVSTELTATDFKGACSVADVPWLAPSIEVYFEDPDLPTILLGRFTVQQCRDLSGFAMTFRDSPKNEELMAFLLECAEGPEQTFVHALETLPNCEHYLQSGELPAPTFGYGPKSCELTVNENNDLRTMVNLALKVLVFASTPVHLKTPLTRKQMHYGGKPDIRNRPARPSFRITYLPHVIRNSESSGHRGQTRDFHGHIGYIRWYRHERFVHRRGTWDYVRPAVDPATGEFPKRQFKVVKPV